MLASRDLHSAVAEIELRQIAMQVALVAMLRERYSAALGGSASISSIAAMKAWAFSRSAASLIQDFSSERN
jgi:hypothetical protein